MIRLGVAQTVAREIRREAREDEKQIRCRAVLTRGYCQKYVALASREVRWRDTGGGEVHTREDRASVSLRGTWGDALHLYYRYIHVP